MVLTAVRVTINRGLALEWRDMRCRVWLLLLCCGSALGCQGANSEVESTERGVKIVTTTGMVTDIVREVVGDRGRVSGMIQSGSDPHLFRPSRRDLIQLKTADVVVYSGLHLEGQMTDTLGQLSTTKQKRPSLVFAVTQDLARDQLRTPELAAGHPDPHVWMDVGLWSKCVETIAEELANWDPPHAAEYRERAVAYRGELAELDRYVREVIQSIPEPQRHLVTAHDAFGYFGRAYGIEVAAVQGISTESEAGVQDINRLVDLLVSQRIPAIFVESSVNEKYLRAVLEGAKSRGMEVKIGGQLYSDAMGSEGTYEGTYVGMLDSNASTIAKALGGTVPEGGFRGWRAARSSAAAGTKAAPAPAPAPTTPADGTHE